MNEPGVLQRLAWVGAGSAVGGLMRFGLTALGGATAAVFVANVAGAFVIGLYAALTGANGAIAAGPRQRLFVMPGLLAGLTSFSAFSLQADVLLQSSIVISSVFVLASLGSWAVGVWAGEVLALRLHSEWQSSR